MTQEMIDKLKDNNFTDEQIKFVKDNVIKEYNRINGYRIKCGIPYIVNKQYFKNYIFYKIPVYGKTKDGETKVAYRTVQFVGCDPVREDKDKIIIKRLLEDFYFKETDAYNPIWILKILDYEYVESEVKEQRETSKALEQYVEEVNYNLDDLPF